MKDYAIIKAKINNGKDLSFVSQIMLEIDDRVDYLYKDINVASTTDRIAHIGLIGKKDALKALQTWIFDNILIKERENDG